MPILVSILVLCSLDVSRPWHNKASSAKARASQRSPISDGKGIARAFQRQLPLTMYGHACRLWPEVQARMPPGHPSMSWTLTALIRLHTSDRGVSTTLKSTPASQLIPQLPSTASHHVAALVCEAVSGTIDSASAPPNQAGSRDMGSAAPLAEATWQQTEARAVTQHSLGSAAGSEAVADLPAELQPRVQTGARTEQQSQTQARAQQSGVGLSAGSLSQQHGITNRMRSHSCAAQHSQATVAYTGTTQQYYVPQNATQLPYPGTQPLGIQDAGHEPVHGQDWQLPGQRSAESPAAAEKLHAAGHLHAPLDEVAGPSNSQVRRDVC